MATDIRWNRKPDYRQEEAEKQKSVGMQIMDYVHFMKEEGKRGETREAYANRVYAKAYAGKKLSPDEMNFLARTNPVLYQKVLRAQIMRRALENRLKSCSSRQEAEEVFTAAISSISEKDPDRDMLLSALNEAYKEFRESNAYKSLPETEKEAEKSQGNGIIFEKNENGYQEAYLSENSFTAFMVEG